MSDSYNNSGSKAGSSEECSGADYEGMYYTFFDPPRVPFEAAFMPDAPDNAHSRDPLNLPPKSGTPSPVRVRPATPAQHQQSPSGPVSPSPPGNQQRSISQRSQPSNSSSSGTPISSHIHDAGASHRNSPASRPQSQPQNGLALTGPPPAFGNIPPPYHGNLPLPAFAPGTSLTATDLVSDTTPRRGNPSRLRKPNVTLQDGFAWDRASLTLLAYWKNVNKKGATFLSTQGDFPGKSAQEIQDAWNQNKDLMKVYWEEYEVADKA
ncbi:hypothetical protein BKA63DRAFT_579204 [Paraphoma chrysanthemicola]|nr:hypothetical protein BKA63DRAFT_579204 [Paraphoma chrysanthemicola]